MKARQILIPAAVVLLSVGIVVLSAWAVPALARGPRPGGAWLPFMRPGGGLPFERFGRFGPFGRHLGGWRGLASAVASFGFVYLTALLTILLFPRPLRRVRAAFGQGRAKISFRCGPCNCNRRW